MIIFIITTLSSLTFSFSSSWLSTYISSTLDLFKQVCLTDQLFQAFCTDTFHICPFRHIQWTKPLDVQLRLFFSANEIWETCLDFFSHFWIFERISRQSRKFWQSVSEIDNPSNRYRPWNFLFYRANSLVGDFWNVLTDYLTAGTSWNKSNSLMPSVRRRLVYQNLIRKKIKMQKFKLSAGFCRLSSFFFCFFFCSKRLYKLDYFGCCSFDNLLSDKMLLPMTTALF